MTNLKVFIPTYIISKETNLITPKWVFKYKKNSYGNIEKRKARLVAGDSSNNKG